MVAEGLGFVIESTNRLITRMGRLAFKHYVSRVHHFRIIPRIYVHVLYTGSTNLLNSLQIHFFSWFFCDVEHMPLESCRPSNLCILNEVA